MQAVPDATLRPAVSALVAKKMNTRPRRQRVSSDRLLRMPRKTTRRKIDCGRERIAPTLGSGVGEFAVPARTASR